MKSNWRMVLAMGGVVLAGLGVTGGASGGGGTSGGGGDWAYFRGPMQNGASAEKGWLTQWPADGPKVAWRAKVGIGASSVTVSGGKVYTAGNDGKDTDAVWCFDAQKGTELWRYTYPCRFADRSYDGGTAGTPTVDGANVYNLSYTGILTCLDGSGKKVWENNLKKMGGKPGGWGYACSPLVEGKLLIVDVGGKGTSTVAFDKAGGEVVWKSGDYVAGYSSPVAMDIGKTRAVLIFKATEVVAVNVATGQEMWKTPWPTKYGCGAAAVLPLGADQVFITSGYDPGECGVLQVSPDKATVVWKNTSLKSHVTSAVARGGFIYGIDGQLNDKNSKVKCLDAKTGAEKWAQSGLGTGALMLADDKLIIQGEHGVLAVAQAAPDGYKELARVQALDKKTTSWVQPVLANGFLYAKNNKGELVCLDVRGK